MLDAKNLEGTKISDTLYGGVKDPGTFNGKFVALNYVMTVYGIWYSEPCSRPTASRCRRPGRT